MEIKQVVVHIEATINLGNYENFKPAITVTAEMTQEEIDDGGILDLAKTAREELAGALVDVAGAQLSQYRWDEPGEETDNNLRRALDRCPEFRWIHKLYPEAATDLLNDIVRDYWEAKRAKEAEEAAAQDAINAAAEAAAMAKANTEVQPGTYVIDLNDPDDEGRKAFEEFS